MGRPMLFLATSQKLGRVIPHHPIALGIGMKPIALVLLAQPVMVQRVLQKLRKVENTIHVLTLSAYPIIDCLTCRLMKIRVIAGRSEEHTSELQSRQYLVCRLLL